WSRATTRCGPSQRGRTGETRVKGSGRSNGETTSRARSSTRGSASCCRPSVADLASRYAGGGGAREGNSSPRTRQANALRSVRTRGTRPALPRAHRRTAAPPDKRHRRTPARPAGVTRATSRLRSQVAESAENFQRERLNGHAAQAEAVEDAPQILVSCVSQVPDLAM